MKRIFTHLFVAVLLMLSSTSWAQLKPGVYNIVNVETNTSSMAVHGVDRMVLKVTDTGDDAQLWYVAEGTAANSYTVRSLENGLYLQGAGTSTRWTLSTTPVDLYYVEAGDNHTFSLTNNSSGNDNMHYGANEGYVVGWTTSASATQWVFNSVEISDSELQANWDAIGDLNSEMNKVATYQALLDNIFSDKSCTAFKDGYSYSTNEANYAALPHELQAMVTKINAGDWEEPNAVSGKPSWNNDYAKKFRVQMYEPYSCARTGSDGVTSWLGINWHSNNDNPTGVYIHKRGLVYVMVQGEIAQGASLRIVDAGSNNRIANVEELGYELKTGLNIIPCYGSGGMLYICYNVDTYNHEGKTAAERFPENRKLSNYAPLKIHIEGGAINGFYNACGDFRANTDAEDLWKTFTGASVDKDADWEYMETRANLSVLPILGNREILLLQFEDESGQQGLKSLLPEAINCPSTPYSYAKTWGEYGMGCDPSTGKINIVMEAWDRIMYSQLATMGLLSKADMAKMNDFYPRWNADGTRAEIYDYSNKSKIDGFTLEEFCGVDYSEYFNHHGSILGTGGGNPYGSGDHVGYPIQQFSDAVNNLPNTAGSTWGPAHEIGHQHQGLLTLNGLMEVTNNLFSNIALWYKGMSTSRYNGNEGSLESVLNAFNSVGSDIYTNNIWALTHLYYRLWLYYHLAGNNTQFYPRLFELLRHEPMVRAYQQAGDVSTLHFYKLVCQAAGEDLTEFFRAHGYFSVMEDRLVGDYSNSVYNVSQQMIDDAIAEVKDMGLKENLSILFINDDENANYVQHDGKTKRVIYGETTPNSDFGSVTDFIADNVATTPYTATVDLDGTVKMSGGYGAVGFLLLNDKGEILSFSNKSTFALSDEVKHQLVTGKAAISAVNAKSETVEVEIDLASIQKAMLESLVADIEAMPIDDGTYTHVGFYKKAFVADMLAAFEKANSVLEAGNGGYAAAYEILYSEYQKVKVNPDSKITLDLNKKYIISNNAYTTRNIVVDGETVRALENNTTAAQWSFVETGTAGSYYLKNAEDYYCPAVVTGDIGGNATKEQASAGVYTLKELKHGLWAIVGKNASMHASESQNYNIVGWTYEATASQWYITASETDEKNINIAELQALIAKTEALVNEVAIVELSDGDTPVALQTTNTNGNFYVRTNATNTGGNNEGPIANLVDGNIDNFFHTQWGNNAISGDGLDHYIEVSMGDGALSAFSFSYTTRSAVTDDFPQVIKVYGSNTENTTGDESGYVLLETVSSGLPTSGKTTYTYYPSVIEAGTAYKYLRFMVPTTNKDRKVGSVQHNYWHMAEFDILPVNTTATLRDGFISIKNETVIAAYHAMKGAAVHIANPSLTTEQLKTAKTALQVAYGELVKEYNAISKSTKDELQALIDATNELIASVGEAVATDNVKVNLLGKLYAERVYDAEGTGHSDYSSAENGYNLLDGNVNTHFHSDYDTNTMVSPPYLRVDLGEGNSAKNFKFNYTTRNQEGCAPTKINVYGGNVGVARAEILSSAALNAVTTPTKIVIKNLSGTNSKYFAGTSNVDDINAAVLVWEPVEVGVAGKYYLRTTDAENGYIQNGNTTVGLGTKDNAQVFVTTSPSTTGTDATYFNGESLVDADLGNLVRFVQEGGKTWLNCQSSSSKPVLGNTGKGGWTVHNVYLVTNTPSYDAEPIAIFTSLPTGTSEKWTSADIASTKDYRFFKFEVAESQGRKTENGNTKYYFAISEFGFDKVGEVSATIKPEYQGLVSKELLIETRRTVYSSETMLAYSNDIEMLKAQITQLQAAKVALEEAMVSTSALKAQLNELLYQAQTLYVKIANENDGVIDDYYKSAIGQEDFGTFINEIREAGPLVKENANPTAADLQTAISELGAICEKINGIIAADFAQDSRTAIEELVAEMETLLGEVADKTTAKTAIALQTTDANADFYIWSNAKASDCDGVGASALIDKNDDGTANTGTFFGTVWQGGAVAAYTHYIEIDLSADIALCEFSIDYITRNSGAADSRPTGLKFYGSNDKEEYSELFSVTEGLPTTENTKWEMDAPYELAKNYRYIRIAVASVHGSCFNMSDFNLYAHSALVANSKYQPAGITGEQLFAMNAALLAGIDARDKFVTEENYNVALAALQTQYDALLAIKSANISDRNSLAELIGATNTLVAEVAKIDETEAKIALQCDDENAPYYIYCNAPGATNNYPGDNSGVAALLDVDDGGEPITATFLHTSYVAGSHDDDLDHYLRVDMGEANLLSFKFRYTPRIGNTDNAPLVMLIEGSNDCVNFEEITTLTDMTTTYQSQEITNGKAYRYIRFMVKETHNHSKLDNHEFFAMSHFEMTACKTIEVAEEYASPNLPLSTVVAANNEAVDGTTVKEQFYVTETVYNTAIAELQAAKDALETARLLKNIPVILTTDTATPVLYKIYIGRTEYDRSLLAYDENSSMVAVANLDFESTVQDWYFMQGTDENSYSDVLILPATADGKALATNSFSEGNSKVSAQDKGTTGYSYNWEISPIDDTEWYNIKMNNGSDTYYYFSNHGGYTNKMGFYNSSTNSDLGSRFRFVLADAYSVLKDCYEPLEKEPEVYAPGYFSNAEQYNAAYDAASEYVNFANGTEEQYIAAYNELFAQKKALTTRTASHALEDGAVYRIMNLITKTEPGYEYHYIKNNNASITFPTTPAEDKSDLWVCKANEDGTYEFVSALGTATLGWNEDIKETNAGAVKENATKFVVATGVANGAKRMAESNYSMSLTNELWNSKGEALFNRAGNDGKAQSENWSTDWYFQKVELEDADVKFNVNISSRRFSSLYLPYNVTVPEGVSAFIAVAVDGGYVDLYCVADNDDETAAGNIIPARTPVILYIEDDNEVPASSKAFAFEYTADDASLDQAIQQPIIYGKILQTPIKCDADARYYKLGSKSGDTVSKMYWMYKEYGEDGTITHPNSDNGGYIRCSANKIYMKVNGASTASAFSMRFAGATTGVDEVTGEAELEDTIYDMQGRRLTEITKPGMYIVNGKKVMVK